MGAKKETTSSNTSSTSTPTPTAEEIAMNKLDLERRQASQGSLLASDQNALSLSNNLMQGRPLPGYLNGLPGGINEEQTQSMVGSSLRDLNAQLAKSGAGTFMESGAAQAAGMRTAGDIRNTNAQFNLNNLLQLLNLGTGSSAQVQQPMNANNNAFSSRLAGLRSTASQGSSSGSTITRENPFLVASQMGGQMFSPLTGGFGTPLRFCWVAAEIFGGWNHPKTNATRKFMLTEAPEWLFKFYLKFGERIANFISNKRILKRILKPFFEYFAKRGA